MSRRHPRVFLGTTEVAGYYANLALGFSQIGVPVTRLLRTQHPFNYDKRSVPERILQYLGARYRDASRDRRKSDTLLSRMPALEDRLIRRLVDQHDIFIFGAMTSLQGLLVGGPRLQDLELIKRAGKTVICVFHGSEVRPSWLNGSFQKETAERLAAHWEHRKRWLEVIEAHADVIVSHPPMGPLQSVPFAQYLAVGIPMSKPTGYCKRNSRSDVEKDAPLRAVHAPSRPETKGSLQIAEAVEKLRDEGHAIDFRQITGMPNAHVQTALADADFVIDQVYSDTPMGHFAAEAAMHRCPSVVCGNDLDELRHSLGGAFWPPSITGRPEELTELLRWASRNLQELRAVGEAAHDFVTRNWSTATVARNFLYMAEHGIPSEWQFDPNVKKFWGGYGMTLDQRDALIDRIVESCGVDALGLPNGISLPLPRG